MKIDMKALISALEETARDTSHFLDRETGEVIKVSISSPRQIKERIQRSPQRYVFIPRIPSAEGYKDMQEFINTVNDKKIKARLIEAIEGNLPFRDFRHILEGHPLEKERWFKFKDERLSKRAQNWLKSVGIPMP